MGAAVLAWPAAMREGAEAKPEAGASAITRSAGKDRSQRPANMAPPIPANVPNPTASKLIRT